MHPVLKFVAISSVALTLAACDSARDASKSNFGQAIQAYLDTQQGLCAAIPATGLPFTLANQDLLGGQNQKRADALVHAGLLSKRDTEAPPLFGDKMEPAAEYQVTDTGKKFLVAHGANTPAGQDAFCTGRYTLVAVDSFTEPRDVMGVRLSKVNYHYKVDGADNWAKLDGIRANYKNFEEQTQGDMRGKAVVILTNDGWMHERLFRRGGR